MTSPIILASGSAIRRRILEDCGLAVEIAPADIDEVEITKQALRAGLTAEHIAIRLAQGKAHTISKTRPGLVIGADQILEFDGALWDKPAGFDDLRARLKQMQSRAHALINGVVLAQGDQTLWRWSARAELHMRALSDQQIDRYLSRVDDSVLKSVGGYQVEGLGLSLFERIDGDYFSVLGLDVLPLLNKLAELRCEIL
ncbi:MAG: Maf family protein [Maricaulaceae bacterium]